MYNAQAFSDHWVDVVVTALLAVVGYFVSDRLRAMDARHQRAEDKFEEVDKDITDCKERLSSVEARCDILHSRRPSE